MWLEPAEAVVLLQYKALSDISKKKYLFAGGSIEGLRGGHVKNKSLPSRLAKAFFSDQKRLGRRTESIDR